MVSMQRDLSATSLKVAHLKAEYEADDMSDRFHFESDAGPLQHLEGHHKNLIFFPF